MLQKYNGCDKKFFCIIIYSDDFLKRNSLEVKKKDVYQYEDISGIRLFPFIFFMYQNASVMLK